MSDADAPTPVTKYPSHLSPQFCLDTTALRDFLRLSRATVDDSISAHLNSLIHPAEGGFAPATLPGPRSRRNVPDVACQQFKRQVLFASWRSRDHVLTYCRRVADEPSSVVAEEQPPQDSPASTGMKLNNNYWGQPTVVDERTDPYSGRDYNYTRESAAEVLRGVLDTEAGVERIVRRRTWAVLGERCERGASDESKTLASSFARGSNTSTGDGWEAEYTKASESTG